MVGYVLSLDFDKSELPPPLLSWTGMIDIDASFQEYVMSSTKYLLSKEL